MDYKEKLEEAKRLYKTANADQQYVLESLFPQLKESEDERIRKELIAYFEENDENGYVLHSDRLRWVAWLEKYKYTEEEIKTILQTEYEKGRADAIAEMQNPAWSEEDYNRFKNLCDVIDKSDWNAASKEGFKNWLKSLCPRSNQEIDEQIETIAMHLDNCGDTAMAKILRSCNLCPQKHWKPSRGQIEAIEDAIEFLGCTKEVRDDLKSLYEQLKKLKG